MNPDHLKFSGALEMFILWKLVPCQVVIVRTLKEAIYASMLYLFIAESFIRLYFVIEYLIYFSRFHFAQDKSSSLIYQRVLQSADVKEIFAEADARGAAVAVKV